MSYSSPAQFRAFVDRDKSAGARSANQWGQSGTEQTANMQLALDAAASRLNAAARRGGYTTPITQASLGVTDAEWAEALAWLQVCEMAMATGSNLFPEDDSPRFKAAREQCKADLELLAAGEALPLGDSAAGGGFEYVSTTGAPTVHFTSLSYGRMRVPIP